jgi:hypothetical protein
MTPAEEMLATFLLQKNAVDYWHDVDTNYGMGTSDFYLKDSTFGRMVGKEAIHQFYVWRKGRGARTSRHVITNFRAVFETPKLARTNNVMLLFAVDGDAPLPIDRSLIQVSEQEDVCVLCDDGKWRYRSRAFTPIFSGEAPATVPPADWFARHSPLKT